MFLLHEGFDETVAEEFSEGFEGLVGHQVEPIGGIDQSCGSEDMDMDMGMGMGMGMGMEPDVVTEGVNGGNSGELTVGKVEPDSHPVAQRLDGDVEKEIEEFTSFPEDPAEGFRDGENELAVRDVETDAG